MAHAQLPYSPDMVAIPIKGYLVCAEKPLQLIHECIVVSGIVHCYGANLKRTGDEDSVQATRHVKMSTYFVLDARFTDDLVEEPGNVFAAMLTL